MTLPLGMDIFLAFLMSFSVVFISGLLLWRPVFNKFSDSFIKRLMKDPYPENIGEMYNVITKVGVQNVLESDLRGSTGEPLKRPFGSPLHPSPWDKLYLNSVYLAKKPVVESVEIDTKVVIGKQAKRPLHIDMPITIGGMAYGFGLSLKAKLALAKGADMVKTASNTGAGPFLPEERKHVKRLIVQYNRGFWSKEEEVLRQADALEILLGYGAHGSGPVIHKYKDLSPEFRDYMKLKPGQDLIEEATLPDVKDGEGLKKLVDYLRQVSNGAPIGIKFGASQNLEQELEIFTAAGIDFLSVSGAESGINYSSGALADDTGLPTLPALCRTVRFLENRGLKEKISVIISGGLVTPGHFLKALALGADAVAVGTVALIALVHTEIIKVLPWEPPTELVYDNGKAKDRFSVDKGAKSLANFLTSCNEEIKMAMRSMGKTSLGQLSYKDLSASTPETAKMAGVELNLFPPQGQGGAGK